MIKSASLRSNGLPNFLGASSEGRESATCCEWSKSESSSRCNCNNQAVSSTTAHTAKNERGTRLFDAVIYVAFEATEQAEEVQPHLSLARCAFEYSLGRHDLDETGEAHQRKVRGQPLREDEELLAR